jgi:hypothetical protein
MGKNVTFLLDLWKFSFCWQPFWRLWFYIKTKFVTIYYAGVDDLFIYGTNYQGTIKTSTWVRSHFPLQFILNLIRYIHTIHLYGDSVNIKKVDIPLHLIFCQLKESINIQLWRGSKNHLATFFKAKRVVFEATMQNIHNKGTKLWNKWKKIPPWEPSETLFLYN